MDGPVAVRLALCPEEGIEDLVRAQTRVARSIEAARALVAQVKQELTKAVSLITSLHPPDPSSLELTTRKLLRTSGLLARHLTERIAFEEALPTFSDEIFIHLLRRREDNFVGVRLEALRACARLIAAFPELMTPRVPALLDAIEASILLSKDNYMLRVEVQLGFEVVQLLLAHNPTLILHRVPMLLCTVADLLSPVPPPPFSVLELLTLLAHLLDGCCDADLFPVPAPALTTALSSHRINSDSSFWLRLSTQLLALANDHDHQSAALSALESLGPFNQHYLPAAARREVQSQVLPTLLQALATCIPNSDWQVLKAAAKFVPGLALTDLDRLFAALEQFVQKLQTSTLKPSAKDKQRGAAVTVATALVREYGPRLSPHCDRFLGAVLAPLRDPLLCAELIQALASDATTLSVFLPRLLRGLLTYASSPQTGWQLLREVYETLGLIAEHGGRAAAVYAAEMLGAVLTTLPRALLHAGAEGLTCLRRVLLCDGVSDRVITDHSTRVTRLIWSVLKEQFDGAAPLEEEEQEDEVDLDATLALEALDCARRLAIHPRLGPLFGNFGEVLVDFLLGAITKPILMDDEAQVRTAQIDTLVQLLLQRPALRGTDKVRRARQAITVAAGLLREEDEEEAGLDAQTQSEKLLQLQ